MIGRCLFILLALWLAGCSAPQTRQLERSWPAAAPERHLLDSVPFHPQALYQCGPAALATVLQHGGFSVTPAALIDEVYLPARQGSLQLEMLAAARARGAVVYPMAGRLSVLIDELRAGHPVLVLQNLGLDWAPQWHYAVVIGYDRESAEFILRSGQIAERRTGFSAFERTWARGGYWAQLVLPPGQLPANAELRPYLRAVLNRDRAAGGALAAWRAATGRWPEAPLAWLALGNAEFHAGQLEAASRSYRRATELDPAAPLGWNNYASALGKLGCGTAARAALGCGLRLAPKRSSLLQTQRELAAVPDDGASCPPPPLCATAE